MGHHHRQHNTFNCDTNTRPKQGPAVARLDRERLRATRHEQRSLRPKEGSIQQWNPSLHDQNMSLRPPNIY